MKRIILASIFLALFALGSSQTEKTIPVVGPKRAVKLWLPNGYSASKTYPALFVLGTVDARLVAVEAAYYCDYLHQIPPVIVVGVDADSDDMGFIYETGGVSEAGKRFAKWYFGELIPSLEKSYHLAKYKAYIGHSYGATYTDYLLKEHPEAFHGYALLAPEQPGYKLQYGPLLARTPKPFYYYVAAADGDVDRRKEHERAVAEQLQAMANGDFHFKSELLQGADHMTSVPRGISSAIEFLFSDYKSYGYEDSDGDLSSWFTVLNGRIQDLYGSGIRNDSYNASYFMELAVGKKDFKAFQTVENYFLTEHADAAELFNAGYLCCDLGMLAHAEQLLWKAIKLSKQTGRADFELMAYRTLALRVDADQDEKAWSALEEGYAHSHDVAYLYFFGMISARKGYRVDDGIRQLQAFEVMHDQSFFGTLYPVDSADVLLAKCYLFKHDKAQAKVYVEKALKKNPENKAAKELQGQL